MDNPMALEWKAWREVCDRLTSIGIDINKQDALAAAIKRWGEALVDLRRQAK